MRKNFSIILLAVICAISITACFPSKNSAPDLIGQWQQVDRSSGKYIVAHISKYATEVYRLNENDELATLYWAGSFSAPVNRNGVFSWDSKNDVSRTINAPLASHAETKTFSYYDGKLSFSTDVGTIELEPGEWGFTGMYGADGSMDLSSENASPSPSDTEPSESPSPSTSPSIPPSPSEAQPSPSPSETPSPSPEKTPTPSPSASSSPSPSPSNNGFINLPSPSIRPSPSPTKRYALNTYTMTIHSPSCELVKDIDELDYSTTDKSLYELYVAGYSTCSVCNPT